MNRIIPFLLFFCLSLRIQAQISQEVDTTLTIDMMVIPNSPAFTLLGISPNSVDKPTTPTDFAFSVINAANSLSGIPKNYAIEIAPVPLLLQKKKTYNQFSNKEHKLMNTLGQTFTISAGFSSSDTVNTTRPGFIRTRSGIGFKVSLLRGKVDTAFDDYKNSIQKVRKELDRIHSGSVRWKDSLEKSDLIYMLLDAERKKIMAQFSAPSLSDSVRIFRSDSLRSALDAIHESLHARIEVVKLQMAKQQMDKAAALKKEIEKIKFKRYGLMLDLAGGLVLGFRNDDFQNSIVQQYAFWMNGGYSMKKGFDFVLLARYNTNVGGLIGKDGKPKELNSFDTGAKIEYTSRDKRFTIGGEAVMRTLSDTTVYRYTFNAGYQVKTNQALTLSVGKNFANDKVNLGGTLIAALNYIIEFGSKRTVVPSKQD